MMLHLGDRLYPSIFNVAVFPKQMGLALAGQGAVNGC